MVFALSLYYLFTDKLNERRWFLWLALFSVPLTYLASELGWVLAELGRQPWIIQDLLTVSKGVSNINTGAVITTFILFGVMFTVLLISDISIIVRQIKNGPRH